MATSPSLLLLGITIALLLILLAIIAVTLGARRKERLEEPKRRMLDDD